MRKLRSRKPWDGVTPYGCELSLIRGNLVYSETSGAPVAKIVYVRASKSRGIPSDGYYCVDLATGARTDNHDAPMLAMVAYWEHNTIPKLF